MAFKHWFTLTTITALACSSAMAQERARVLSSIPVVQQVGVPQQFCEDSQVYSGTRTNGTGAVIGAVLGGLAGNALGQGARHGRHGHYYPSTRAPSTVVGAIAGGLIGHSIEGSAGQPSYETVRRCTTETVYENRTVGYDVTYEYAGQRYSTRMQQHPGQWLAIQVQPQNSYGSAGHSTGTHSSTTRFIGPSGVYQSAPAGVVVTQSVHYTSPGATPVVIGIDAAGYPSSHWRGAPPPPPHHGWR